MCVASFLLLSTMVSMMLKVYLSLYTLLRSHLFVNCCIRRYSLYSMCTIRNSLICLVKHFTVSSMSILSGAAYANFITKPPYQADSIGVSFPEFSICAVCSSFFLKRGESTSFASINFMTFNAPSTSFASTSKVVSSFITSMLIVRFKIFSSCLSLAPNPMWSVCFKYSQLFSVFPTTQKSSS